MHSGVAIPSYLLHKSKLINQTGLQLAKTISKTCKANCYQAATHTDIGYWYHFVKFIFVNITQIISNYLIV